MLPSAAMNVLIEQGYHLFRPYSVPSHFNVCCHYCFSTELGVSSVYAARRYDQ